MSVEHRVHGPPGTGKTSYVMRQAARAAEKYGNDAVLIASLTRAAASEVARRHSQIPKENIGTLHAHAYRALDRPELAETSDGYKAWNQWVQERGLHAHWRLDASGAAQDTEVAFDERKIATAGDAYLAELGLLRARQTPRDAWGIHTENLPGFGDFADSWAHFKAETNRLDFSDLIERALEEVTAPPGMPAVMFLDEAQDLSKLEFALARQWAESCEQIVVVGDVDQALFTWRGADPEAMISGNPASESVLSRSWRVPAAVHDYAVKWIRKVPGRPDIDYEPRLVDPHDESKGVVEGEVARCGHAWTHPEGLVERVLADLDAGMSVMILASCSYMLDPTIAILRRQGVPFHNPYRTRNGAWNPLARGGERLLAFLRPSKAAWGDDARFWRWDDVSKWIDQMESKETLVRGAKSLVRSKVTEKHDFGGMGVLKPAPAQSVVDLFKSEDDAEHAFDLDVDWWENSLLESGRKIARYPCAVYRRRGPRALRDKPNVVVGSIHSVKGGEAESVYVFPDLSQRGYMEGWARVDDRPSTLRMFYVAFTRASEKLTLCAPGGSYHVPFPPT